MSHKSITKQIIDRVISPPVVPAKSKPASQPSQYVDKTITCAGCRKSFTWTAEQQDFYVRHMEVVHEPRYCEGCRIKRREYFNTHPTRSNTRS